MKEIERKLIAELLKNSRRSDRELAKAIGTSQPTTTRLRTKLEKEGYIKEYTILPNFSKIGYAIMALTFLKLDPKLTDQEIDGFRQSHLDTLGKEPFGIILIHRGIGLGYDLIIVSFHQNYASYNAFTRHTKHRIGASITEINIFLINVEESSFSLNFSFLVHQILKLDNKKK